MALYPLQPGMYPLGQFDCSDVDQLVIRGGEVVTMGSTSRNMRSADHAAADAFDGYNFGITPTVEGKRGMVQLATTVTPLNYLADEGVGPDYFTMFGSLVGASAGTVVGGPIAAQGASSMTGSGKCTLWDKPGLYAITTNALHANFTSTLTSAGLTPGSVLGHDNVGKLSHSTANGALAGSGVGCFVEFGGNTSYVTTPARLVGAGGAFDRIKFQFSCGYSSRTVPSTPA